MLPWIEQNFYFLLFFKFVEEKDVNPDQSVEVESNVKSCIPNYSKNREVQNTVFSHSHLPSVIKPFT